MQAQLLYKIALTLVPNIGAVHAKALLQHCEPEEIFHAKKSFLEKIEGIGPIRAAAIRNFKSLSIAENEIRFIEKNQIRPVFITDDDYPKRLLNCYDSPTLLYYKGEAAMNAPRIIAIVGTRASTEYARQVTDQLVKDLAQHDVIIVSGLAFGVDALAHRASIRNNLPTIGILAHGLNQIYPTQHAKLANEMLEHGGGLLTEFHSASRPDMHNFPSRNRIVAGMSDALVVIETGLKGGSIITADLANSYNKDVFAIPGKLNDSKSEGCNFLIKTNKAQLVTDAGDIVSALGWNARKERPKAAQKSLFAELSSQEQVIVDILREQGIIHIDELYGRSGLSTSAIAAAILNLELQNLLLSLPGKMYQLA